MAEELDLARGELDFGLVIENKLALLEGSTQILAARPDLRLGGWRGRSVKLSRFLRAQGVLNSAQLQLAGNHVCEVFKHHDLVRIHGVKRLATEDS